VLKLDCAQDGSWHLLAKEGRQVVMSFVSQGDALDYVRDLNERWNVSVALEMPGAADYAPAAE